ncbi:sulfite exporter TauE/SafE family protein [Telmatospirillum siberiense]|uniref:Sulfite exporter TauE/SafE family protein n=1 Tax=Telmatospirillum siberiense TaxID=382514 RepID=A0A2N3PSK0_9PROT|nr:sulfite exporter TauE/SafE family protein [Telmatospirillum siberiense]PKU23379.1 sulfite exporter TauE/SafE family protein [Telmatospirillum siberiense]
MTDQAVLLALLESGLHQCHVALQGEGGLLGSLALAGLVGGVSHCAGMCGPFVLSQVAARLEGTPAGQMREWHRLSGAAVLPYHLGRAATYAILGGAGAAVTGSLTTAVGGLHWLSAALLLAAALFMAGLAIPSLKRLLTGTNGEAAGWSRILERLAGPLFGQPTGWRGFLLGLLLGFIPCGLLYGALAAAAASGNVLTGMAGMLAFAAGTWPSLFAVGLLGHLAGNRWRAPVLRYAPLLLMINAGMLTWLAWRHVA